MDVAIENYKNLLTQTVEDRDKLKLLKDELDYLINDVSFEKYSEGMEDTLNVRAIIEQEKTKC
tara:strand:+ start:414 stop:602 length:189 start_codon:yes stop_codon:yes gene_type:complete